ENKDRYDHILNRMDRFVNNKMEEDELFSANLENYLNEVALITNADKDKNGVNLMTVHVAKGLEFDVVFITGLEQGLFPNAQCFTPHEKEEERRLFFVAITRARKRCYLSNAKTRFRHGKTDYYEPSEFLQEIDSKYIYQESSSRNLRQSNVRRNLNEYVDFEVRRPTRRLITSTTTSTESKPVGSAQVQNGVIQPGHRVEHATFGLGTVIRIENNNTGLKAIIRFDNCGEKTLLLKYAKLNIV
ncbi:MAG: ATP-binding domain-containing protein, partial [Bacteroidaceae bacterium]|nr:ATP-binding domain-containing protein [Bacteroidaceae bacterium]